MSATPLIHRVRGVTMATQVLDALVGVSFIDTAEQEETDLVVRNTDCQRDVASVIQLESSFYQMSQWSVCQSVWKQELSNWPCSLWRIQHVVIAFPISTFLLLWKYRWSCCMLSSRHWCILQSFLINCCNITRTFWYCDFKCLYFFSVRFAEMTGFCF